MNFVGSEAPREAFIARGAQALARRRKLHREAPAAVSLANSTYDGRTIFLRDAEGEELARYEIRRRAERVELLFQGPAGK